MNRIRKHFHILCIALWIPALHGCKKDQLAPRQVVPVAVPSTLPLNKILFVNDTLGFIAGGDKYTSALLLSTADGGRSWSSYQTSGGDSKSVYGLAADGNRVYAVGYEGKIYTKKTFDPDWLKLQTTEWVWFHNIAFSEPGKSFIVSGEGYRGGRIYRLDGNLSLALVDSFEYELSDIRFADARTGYACGYGAVLQTTDGGQHWDLLDIKGDFFRSISCIGNDDVWMAGYNGSIIHTADGGRTWTKQRNGDNPLQKRYRLRAIVFRDRSTGYAAGDNGLLLKTTDGGDHWSEFESFTNEDLHTATLHPDGSLWVAGAKGTLFYIRE